jgi:hypothetical protein
MKIPKELLSNCENNSGYGYTNYSSVQDEDIAILALINLHMNNKINDTRLKALFSQYRNNTLIRKINTYHCKINNKWYNDCITFECIMDSWKELCDNKGDFDIETCLKYFNLLLNKNRNYCIDHFYFNYIQPIIRGYENWRGFELLNSLNLYDNTFMSYEKFEDTWQATSGYCCSDCDGCLSQYKQNRYQAYIGYDLRDKSERKAKEILNSMKTESALKNKENRLI